MDNIQKITPEFWVSGQITTEDLDDLKRLGVKTIINNRPDHEIVNQPSHAEIQSYAKQLGISYYFLPIASIHFDEQTIESMQKILANCPRPILAFCRSGNRSTHLYLAARPD